MIRPVRCEDVGPLIGLAVASRDAAFVAPNAVRLAEAPYETGAHVLAIRANEMRWDWWPWSTTERTGMAGRTMIPARRFCGA